MSVLLYPIIVVFPCKQNIYTFEEYFCVEMRKFIGIAKYTEGNRVKLYVDVCLANVVDWHKYPVFVAYSYAISIYIGRAAIVRAYILRSG